MVDILLATYNGAKYIREQISSLQGQTCRDWVLHIHDDGSKDGTMDIIREMASDDGRILIHDDGEVLHSPGKNFIHLLQYSTASQIMFCDQDDIWFPDKIQAMSAKLSSLDDSIPQVVYSNASVWNADCGTKGPATLYFASEVKDMLFLNGGVQGASAIFNSKARELMMKYPKDAVLSMHDHLLQLICVSMGNVSALNLPLMYYRSHERQVTGNTKTRIFSFDTLRSKSPVIDGNHYETIRVFRNIYLKSDTSVNSRLFDEYIAMAEQSALKRLWTVSRSGFTLYGSKFRLMLKIIARPYIGYVGK